MQSASRKTKVVLAEQRELITRLETDIETVSWLLFARTYTCVFARATCSRLLFHWFRPGWRRSKSCQRGHHEGGAHWRYSYHFTKVKSSAATLVKIVFEAAACTVNSFSVISVLFTGAEGTPEELALLPIVSSQRDRYGKHKLHIDSIAASGGGISFIINMHYTGQASPPQILAYPFDTFTSSCSRNRIDAARFRARNIELESEHRHSQQTILSLRNEIDTLRLVMCNI